MRYLQLLINTCDAQKLKYKILFTSFALHIQSQEMLWCISYVMHTPEFDIQRTMHHDIFL